MHIINASSPPRFGTRKRLRSAQPKENKRTRWKLVPIRFQFNYASVLHCKRKAIQHRFSVFYDGMFITKTMTNISQSFLYDVISQGSKGMSFQVQFHCTNCSVLWFETRTNREKWELRSMRYKQNIIKLYWFVLQVSDLFIFSTWWRATTANVEYVHILTLDWLDWHVHI